MTNIPQFARQRMQAQPVGEHPDAGVLTAFAEHSLGAAERETVLAHLAACVVCREVVALALPENVLEEVTPVVHSWFRWPVLRWAAVAASAVIVWAAVVVLVPRTSNRDVSAPVVSMQKVQSAPEVSTNSSAARTKASLPAEKEQDRALAYSATPKTASNAPKQMIALDGVPANAGSMDKSGTAGKLQAGAAPAANETSAKSAPPPAPPAAQLAEKKSDNFQAHAADALTGGGAIDAKRESELRALPAQSQAVLGGPIRKDVAAAAIAGTITDTTGAVVPNALVKITNTQTNSLTAVRADSTGSYRTPLTPGVYSVEATSPGFQMAKTDPIAIHGTVAQNFTLRPGAAAESVEVMAAAQAPPPPPASTAPMANTSAPMKAKAEADQSFAGLTAAKAGRLPAASQWRVGKDGALEHSGDGSAWQKVDLSPGLTFRVVISADGAVWAGGTDGALFHGANEGRSWHRVRVGSKDAPVSDAITAISAPNSKSVIVTTSTGEQWSSNDAGRTWKRLNSQH